MTFSPWPSLLSISAFLELVSGSLGKGTSTRPKTSPDGQPTQDSRLLFHLLLADAKSHLGGEGRDGRKGSYWGYQTSVTCCLDPILGMLKGPDGWVKAAVPSALRAGQGQGWWPRRL